ncbi:hypothetical protein LJR289_005213 [Pseudoduganella sp. LjRoot289]|uniref:hypothetical protein n=1 Tax=Pseudoduganella sp. LjRoot289 TaxID=3342314 RepID=UPI003ED0D107
MNHKYFAGGSSLLLAAALAMPARAELVVIVSSKASAPAAELICQAYLGKTKQPAPVNLPEKNAARDQFYAKACHKDPAQVRSIWSKLIFTGGGTPPQEVESEQDMKKTVAADPTRIGYIDKKDVDASVKIVATLN